MKAANQKNPDSYKRRYPENTGRKAKRIVLIGLDGCGKSSNISLMKHDDDFRQYAFIWARWKPLLLKPAYWLLKNPFKNKKPSPGHLQAAKSKLKRRIFKRPIVRMIWMFLALTDYYIQFQVKVIPLILRNKKIIFDRFYVDLFVDQGINFGYSPARIEREIKKYERIFPRVDLYIYLRVSSDVCFQRKDDIPDIEYLRLREAIYERLAENCRWSVLDGEESLASVSYQLKRLIIDPMPDD